MSTRIALKPRFFLFLTAAVIIARVPVHAQQKGQYMPGQLGLNVGILPSPGSTDTNMEINYPADTSNNPSGNAIPPKPMLNIWAVENILTFVPNTKFPGGNLGFTIMVPNGFWRVLHIAYTGSEWSEVTN